MPKDVAGIVLAAGLGTRLRPLAGKVPKPLVPFFSIPLLELIFKKFTLAGITDLGLNTHFLPEKIEDYLVSYNHKVFLSKETPEILGTGGAYFGFKEWVKGRTTVVCNGDVLTSADLKPILQHHISSDALVTLGVLSHPHAKGSQIWVQGGLVVHIGPDHGGYREATPHGFNCIRVLNPRFFDEVPKPEYSEFVPIVLRLIGEGKKVVAFEQPGEWFDLGTPVDYFEAHLHVLREWSKGRDPFLVAKTLQDLGKPFTFIRDGESLDFSGSKIIGPSFIGSQIEALKSNTLGPNVVISSGVSLNEGCHVQSSLVNEGSVVLGDLKHRIQGLDYSIASQGQ
jgi:mannose-1-phosphate guanylyltransferase